jgi:hypothetical protein
LPSTFADARFEQKINDSSSSLFERSCVCNNLGKTGVFLIARALSYRLFRLLGYGGAVESEMGGDFL